MKKQTIKATLAATKTRRKSQVCRVYQLKINRSKLNIASRRHLTRLFFEAKWFYNFLLSQEDVFATDVKNLYKRKTIPVKVGEEFADRELCCLSSQMKQGLLTQIHNSTRGLAQLKKKGQKVGRLKFKRQLRSIPLKQYGNTYRLFPQQQKIKLQGLRDLIRVRGMDQFPSDVEFANAHLLQRHGDYYLHVVTYQPKKNQLAPPMRGIALDFGLNHQVAFSNGVILDFQIPLPKRLRRLYRRFSKAQKGSKNRDKAKQRLLKAFQKHNNQKKEVRNQIVGFLKRHYQVVCFQNDPFAAWQHLWGKKMMNLSLGAIKQILNERISSPSEVPLSFASTQLCSGCGHKQNLRLEERTYRCPECGHSIHRDYNAARNLHWEGFRQLGMESPEVTPAEIESSTQAMLAFFERLPFVCASSVQEPGSLTALA
ncbi:MAG: RNA-guided endonuclease InsQ/TnpB family protein [Candidatus Hodarchaeales archaeon]|jgi:transposase